MLDSQKEKNMGRREERKKKKATAIVYDTRFLLSFIGDRKLFTYFMIRFLISQCIFPNSMLC